MKKETTFIYGLIDPRTNQIKYIGKSDNPKKRLKEHISESRKKNKFGTKKENWINKLFSLNLKPKLKIINKVKFEEYNYWEEFYIKEYKNKGAKLLNYDEKGLGSISRMKELTKKSADKISKKVYQYSLTGDYIKEYNSTREAERETKINHGNISKACNGIFKHTGGFIFSYSKEVKIKPIKNPNAIKKAVLEIDEKNNILEEYISIAEAAKKTGIDASNISRVCNGKIKKIKKRIFKFKIINYE